MQHLQCAAVVKRLALGAAAGLCRWFVGVAGFAGMWSCPEEEAALGNHSAQSPASVWVASPGHAMGHCKVKYSLYCVIYAFPDMLKKEQISISMFHEKIVQFTSNHLLSSDCSIFENLMLKE